MNEMYYINEFLDGNLSGKELYLFRQKLDKSKEFRNKVNLSREIDKSMKILIMVEEAEHEMYTKKIDKFAYELVGDWYRNERNYYDISKYENLFLS